MAAVHTAMMQNMSGGMHDRMMGGAPMGPGMMFGERGMHRRMMPGGGMMQEPN
jgi:hypothetical protein